MSIAVYTLQANVIQMYNDHTYSVSCSLNQGKNCQDAKCKGTTWEQCAVSHIIRMVLLVTLAEEDVKKSPCP